MIFPGPHNNVQSHDSPPRPEPRHLPARAVCPRERGDRPLRAGDTPCATRNRSGVSGAPQSLAGLAVRASDSRA